MISILILRIKAPKVRIHSINSMRRNRLPAPQRSIGSCPRVTMLRLPLTIRRRRSRNSQRWSVADPIAQFADPFDFELDLVARLKPRMRLFSEFEQATF